jgi:hypothetical protein
MNIEKNGIALRQNRYKLGCGEIVELLSDFYNKFNEDERMYLNDAVSGRRSTLYALSWESIFSKKIPTIKRIFSADAVHPQVDIQQPILFIDKDNDMFQTGITQSGWYFWDGNLDNRTFSRDWQYQEKTKKFVPRIETETEYIDDKNLQNVFFNGKHYDFVTDQTTAEQAKKSLLYELSFYEAQEAAEKLYFETKVFIQSYTFAIKKLSEKLKFDQIDRIQKKLDEKIELFKILNSENDTAKRYLITLTSFEGARDKIIRQLSDAKRQEEDEEKSLLNIFGFGSRMGALKRMKLEAEKRRLEEESAVKQFQIEEQRRKQVEEEEARRLALATAAEKESARRTLEEQDDKEIQENLIMAKKEAAAKTNARKKRKEEEERKRVLQDEKIRKEREKLAASQFSVANVVEGFSGAANQAVSAVGASVANAVEGISGAANQAVSTVAASVLPAAQFAGLAPPTLSKEANEVDEDEMDRFFSEQLKEDKDTTLPGRVQETVQESVKGVRQGNRQEQKKSLQKNYTNQDIKQRFVTQPHRIIRNQLKSGPSQRVFTPHRKVGASPLRKASANRRRINANSSRRVGASRRTVRTVNAKSSRRRVFSRIIHKKK